MKLKIFVILTLAIVGCSNSEYIYTKDMILKLTDSSEFTTITTGGTAEGPYKSMQGPTGHHDGSIEYTFETSAGNFPVSHPPIPGHYMQIDGYANKDGDLFWVILKRANNIVESTAVNGGVSR
jgi:hypothetical protein